MSTSASQPGAEEKIVTKCLGVILRLFGSFLGKKQPPFCVLEAPGDHTVVSLCHALPLQH